MLESSNVRVPISLMRMLMPTMMRIGATGTALLRRNLRAKERLQYERHSYGQGFMDSYTQMFYNKVGGFGRGYEDGGRQETTLLPQWIPLMKTILRS